MQNNRSRVVVLGTGGTIAGTTTDASDNVGYTAGQLSASALVEAIPGLAEVPLDIEQIAQIDSKDMSHALWQLLAQRCAHHLARADVAGIVVTHGTDTLEETAWFLQRVLAPAKPIVLTGAMRPATALTCDGPQNLLDAVAVACTEGAHGVVAVLAGRVHGARDVRKLHPYRVDAFGSSDAGPVGVVEEGVVRLFRAWPDGPAVGLDAVATPAAQWPRVEVIVSHAGAGAALVQLLCDDGVHGLVVAGTGNGSLHAELESALTEAQQRGTAILVGTRCASGRIVGQRVDGLPLADDLTPAKARVELLLCLLASSARGAVRPGSIPRTSGL